MYEHARQNIPTESELIINEQGLLVGNICSWLFAQVWRGLAEARVRDSRLQPTRLTKPTSIHIPIYIY